MRQRGDFEVFVERSSTNLLRSAYLLCGDRGIAEDLLQLTLIRVCAHWRAAATSPEAYARRVLINLSRDRARRGRRRVTEAAWSEIAGAGSQVSDRHDHADEVADRSAVMAALAQLPERQREVLVLRFYGDLSVAETALATGATEGTVKSHTSRALSRMRELLAHPVPTVEASPDER